MANFWFKLLRFLPLCAWFAVLSVLPYTTFAYDGQSKTRVAYDTGGESSIRYDAVFMLATGEKKNGTAGDRVLFAKFPEFLAAESGAFRAINPAYAESTAQSGRFFQSGLPARLGNDGIYANSTVEGAIAEFQYHTPGVNPAVFRVQYPASPTLNISPPSGYFSSPLPFTGDANILTAPSLRAPGTVNFLIREGAVPAGRIQ